MSWQTRERASKHCIKRFYIYINKKTKRPLKSCSSKVEKYPLILSLIIVFFLKRNKMAGLFVTTFAQEKLWNLQLIRCVRLQAPHLGLTHFVWHFQLSPLTFHKSLPNNLLIITVKVWSNGPRCLLCFKSCSCYYNRNRRQAIGAFWGTEPLLSFYIWMLSAAFSHALKTL